jgi:hypothetical protein
MDGISKKVVGSDPPRKILFEMSTNTIDDKPLNRESDNVPEKKLSCRIKFSEEWAGD